MRVVAPRAFLPRVAALVTFAAVALALSGCGGQLERQQITLGAETLDVHVADTPSERAAGLQAVDEPAEGEGMLFVWEGAGERAFTLGELDYPVDVVFVDGSSRVTQIVTLAPGGTTRAAGVRPARWVVEVPGGWARENGITAGDLLVLDGPD